MESVDIPASLSDLLVPAKKDEFDLDMDIITAVQKSALWRDPVAPRVEEEFPNWDMMTQLELFLFFESFSLFFNEEIRF